MAEKVRLLSLAMEFGFDEDSANKCLDRLILLYGEDGQDFITVEHCGDDFLAMLAECMQDTEEWDDVQAMETETFDALTTILGEDNFDCQDPTSKSFHVIQQHSPKIETRQNILVVDSEDSEVEIFENNWTTLRSGVRRF